MDGHMVNWRDAKVHVLTHALHYASAVFEGERAYGGHIFKSAEHSRRLRESARILDFEMPWSVAEIDAAKAEVLKRNHLVDAYVRPIAWRGSEMMGVSAQHNMIHLGIAVWEWPSYFDPAQRMKGIRLDIADYRRPDPATAPAHGEGGRPLHDLHDLQAPRGAPRICGRPDVRLAGPGGGMHGRQRLFRQGRNDSHADRRLLPRRHHPRDGDRSRSQARI